MKNMNHFKSLLFFQLFFIGMVGHSFGQDGCILWEDFENRTNNNSPGCQNIIASGLENSGGGNDIGVSHGTPRLVTSQTGCPSFGLLIGINGNNCSEGFFFNTDFCAQADYTLSFSAYFLTNAATDLATYNLNFIAATGLVDSPNNVNTVQCTVGGNTCAGTPPNNVAQQQIATVPYTTFDFTCTRVDLTIPFTPVIDFSQLWIYPTNVCGDAMNVGLVLDSICVVRSIDCNINPTFNSQPIGGDLACLEYQFENTTELPCDVRANYLWEFIRNGVIIGNSFVEDPVFTFPAHGNYTVSLTITFENCQINTAAPFPVWPCGAGEANGGNNIGKFNTSGAHTQNTIKNIFPNPVSEDVTVELWSPAQEIGILSLIDVSGRVVHSTAVELFENNVVKIILPTSALPNGIYMLEYKGGNNHSVEKIVVE